MARGIVCGALCAFVAVATLVAWTGVPSQTEEAIGALLGSGQPDSERLAYSLVLPVATLGALQAPMSLALVAAIAASYWVLRSTPRYGVLGFACGVFLALVVTLVSIPAFNKAWQYRVKALAQSHERSAPNNQ